MWKERKERVYMILFLEILIGFVIDCFFGDPHSITHPVQRIGKLIQFIEKRCRTFAKGNAKKEQIAGVFLFVLTVGVTYGVMWLILMIANMIHPWLRIGIETFFIYQILAAKSLATETMKVYRKLKEGNLLGARKAISYLVGRDTDSLTEEEIAKAAVETIAENTSDGVIAPLFFIALGGAPLGMAYKAVNTLDSMVGYRNKEYEYLGKCSAKCDDLVNLIPARISALLLIGAAAFLGYDSKMAIGIYARDRYNHLSPNSAHTESVVAGALNIQLGGTHNYFGKPVKKPTIGDTIRDVQFEDIRRTNRMMYIATILMIACTGAIQSLLW